MRVQAKTDTGLVRERNEDSHLVCPDRGLFAVADGMGGHQAGEVASQLAVGVLDRLIGDLSAADPGTLLDQAAREANRAIFDIAPREADKAGMGTTLTAAVVRGNWLYAVHIGDSRLYLRRDGTFRLLTGDHSVVAELVKCGGLTTDEALHHPQRHVLTRALGTCPDVQVDLLKQQLIPGDQLLLCTDGLSNLVNESEMEKILGGRWDEVTADLVHLALDQGGYDNITVVVVEV